MKREAFAVQRAWIAGGIKVWQTVAMFDSRTAAEEFDAALGGPHRHRVHRVWINSGPIPSERAVRMDD